MLPEIKPYQKVIDTMDAADAVVLELAATYDMFRGMGSDHRRPSNAFAEKKARSARAETSQPRSVAANAGVADEISIPNMTAYRKKLIEVALRSISFVRRLRPGPTGRAPLRIFHLLRRALEQDQFAERQSAVSGRAIRSQYSDIRRTLRPRSDPKRGQSPQLSVGRQCVRASIPAAFGGRRSHPIGRTRRPAGIPGPNPRQLRPRVRRNGA